MPMETQNGSREWITVIEYILAGQFVLPVIIYKGEGTYHGWASTIDDTEALFGHQYLSFQP